MSFPRAKIQRFNESRGSPKAKAKAETKNKKRFALSDTASASSGSNGKSNQVNAMNEHYELQIRDFEKLVKEKEKQVLDFILAKDELSLKLGESEKKNNRLEEANLDYERKIISLEGTIIQLKEECKNKEMVINELKENKEVYKMYHTVLIECLNKKISTLENEIKDLNVNSKNEATIFGLETQILNLNGIIEKLNNTITGLDVELGRKIQELQKLLQENYCLKEEVNFLQRDIREEKKKFERKIAELVLSQQSHLEEMNQLYAKQD